VTESYNCLHQQVLVTAPEMILRAMLGWTPSYGDYMSGQRVPRGGEGVTCEELRYTNGALRMRFHYPPLEQSEFYVATPELRMHPSCYAFLAVE
jgi:hypothetical protein